ncbi:DUF6188 family protein [Nocardia nova]|uniref:DUF6188 family protein n=1 Tax=Nocardia nova TaxID=37330 RepID=UPI0033E410DF
MTIANFATLNGLEVEQVWVWKSYLRLVFDMGGGTAPAAYVDLTDFLYTDDTGEQEVRVEDDPRTAGPVLSLLNHRVTAAEVRNWELALTFDTGARIACPPDPDYEAWAACLPDNTSWFCPPGEFSVQTSTKFREFPMERPGLHD